MQCVRVCVQLRLAVQHLPSHCSPVSAVQASSSASTGEGLSAAADHHSARVVNMLRGGILHVNIRKRMDMDEEAKGELPSSARQVKV